MMSFGSAPRFKVISSGTFYCPNCKQLREYKQKQFGKYLMVMGEPLFQTKKLAITIECQACFRQYGIEALKYKPQPLNPTSTTSDAKIVNIEDNLLVLWNNIYDTLGCDEIIENGKWSVGLTQNAVYMKRVGECIRARDYGTARANLRAILNNFAEWYGLYQKTLNGGPFSDMKFDPEIVSKNQEFLIAANNLLTKLP